MMEEKIIPYQSYSKSGFLILGFILMCWCTLFSVFLIAQGAWPVSLFLGIEYVIVIFLIRLYFKENNIKDLISISEKEISLKKFKGNKIFYSSNFNTYWSKFFFTRSENESTLLIRESDKEIEFASFLHAELKESLYKRINKKIKLYS